MSSAIRVIIFFICCVSSAVAQNKQAEKIILDTDFGNDCDDAGALAILHQMAYAGEAEILGVMYPMNDDTGAPAIDAVNTYYGKPNIPIGTYKGNYVYKEKHNDYYNSAVYKNSPNDLQSGKNAPDAVALYREILASQPDNSVTIVVVGPQRLVADLLLSKPDKSSKLNGEALVKKKVRQLVTMGAEYPRGDEWNIKLAPDAARIVAEKWPTPVVYSGFEIGKPIMTGARLFSETPENNPVRIAFANCPMLDKNKDRHSWDETAVLYAVRGAQDYWESGRGLNIIDEKGKNMWKEDPQGKHIYLKQKMTVEEIKKVIEDMMVASPKN